MRRATAGIVLALALASLPATALEEWAIDSGTTGLLVEDHRAPLLFVRIEFPAGSWSPWVVAHDAETAFEVQLHDSAGELRRRSDLLAASLWLHVGARESTLSLACRKQDAEAALELVRDLLANRDFDRAELRRKRRNTKLAWEASVREPQFLLGQAALRALFRRDDPRRPAYPRRSTLDVARLADARDALVRLPGRVVGFAGDVTLDEARRLATALLPSVSSAAPSGLDPRFGPIVAAENRPREMSVSMKRLTQVYFAYGRDSLAWLDPDYPASLIADHVLGGHFNSRLMLALRQEGGDTYGAWARNLGGFDAGAYGLGTFTKVEGAAAVEQKLRDVLLQFHTDGITEAERALAAGNVVGRRAYTRQSPGSILAIAMTERRHDLPYGFFDRQADEAAALPLAQVNEFIRTFYDPRSFTMLTLRPE